MSYAADFLAELSAIAALVPATQIEALAVKLAEVRQGGGRLFILGVGGSAANASHAACDFRKAAGFEAYAPTDNVAEVTANTNDDGWESVFVNWLRISRLGRADAVMILSVGGGSRERNVSPNLVAALDYAWSVNASILGIVGRDGGYTAQLAEICVVIPTINEAHVTAHSEIFQAVAWHLLVTHPLLQVAKGRWETIAGQG